MLKNTDPIAEHNLAQRKYFEETDKPRMVPTETPYIKHQVDEMLAIVKPQPGQKMLEVGCGMGRCTIPLWERGLAVEGLELSPVLLERLRAYDKNRHPYPLYSADVLNPPAELLGQYDLVLGFFTLHHFYDLAGCFSSMYRLLKPGGTIAFMEPNAYNLLYYIQVTFTPGMTWKGDGGIVNMRPNVVFPAMQQAGFKNLGVHGCGFFPPFVANHPWGAAIERKLERFKPLNFVLPFQIFYGTKE